MRLFRTLILSLIFHLLLAWGLTKVPALSPRTPSSPSIVELMETAPPNSSQDDDESLKQFVRSAPAPKDLLTKEKKEARFASEDEQNVLEERRARASGMTANRSEEGGPKQGAERRKELALQPQVPKSARPEPKSRKPLDLKPETPLEKGIADELGQEVADAGPGDVKVGGLHPRRPTDKNPKERRNDSQSADGSKPLDLPNFLGAEKGTSTLGESVPDDIKFGDFTALNTDRHLFYSFYSRMEEAVRPSWVRHARAAMYAYDVGAKRLTGTETWSTRVELLLTPDGKFLRGILHSSSGIPALDAAPIQAFRDAIQIPHPPAEMVKEDGMIHVYCQFTVNVAPQYARSGE